MKDKSTNKYNIPNAITVARIFMVPVVIWALLTNEFFLAFIFFTIAGASDFVDGWLARFQKIQTKFGANLDPVADKLLMGTTYITLAWLGYIPLWLIVLVISRDLFIMAGVIIVRMRHQKLEIKPLMISKINTLAQICLVVFLLADLAFMLNLGTMHLYVFILVALTTIISFIAYLTIWVKTITKPMAK